MTEQGTEFSQKGFESMTAEEIAATQESEVAITVGDPVPASEQNNATVEIQGQPIGRQLSRQLTQSVANPGATAAGAQLGLSG